jgi:hypothetical protein
MLPDLPPLPPIETLVPLELKRSSFLPGPHTAPTASCVLHAAERNDLDPYVLLAVLKTENGKPGEVARNDNGTHDLGPMSVNTVWLPQLAQRYGASEAEMRRRLASDGCANVAAGAWILRRKIDEAGDLWEGVAHFHSRNPKKHTPYLKRVYARFREILERAGEQALHAERRP